MSTQPVNSPSFQTQPSLQIARTLPESGAVRLTVNRPRQFVPPPADISRGHLVAPGLAWYLPLKRCCDLVLATVILVLVVPLLVLAALLIKLSSRGPALYRQVRLGLDGRPFTLIKLRTMKHDAEAQSGPVWRSEEHTS